MASNAISRTPNFNSRFLPSKPSSLSRNPITVSAISGHRNGFNLRRLGFDCIRFRAVSNGGSGGDGGGFGGSGFGSGSGGSGDEEGQNGHSLLSWYMMVLEKHPVVTKALTSALLNCTGDLICQLLIDKVPALDIKRSSLFTFLGLVLVGPTLHFWYLYLSKLVSLPGGSGAFLRLLLDQFLFSPLFIGFFISCLVTLEGRPSEIVPKLQQEWFSTVLANWQLWIPFQFLNFLYVPQQFQLQVHECIDAFIISDRNVTSFWAGLFFSVTLCTQLPSFQTLALSTTQPLMVLFWEWGCVLHRGCCILEVFDVLTLVALSLSSGWHE